MTDTNSQSTSHLNEGNISDQTLSDIFDKCLELHRVVDQEDSDTEKYKTNVRRGISHLEEATRKVNMLSLFSCNETIDEVATADLKYLLLPALLGSFTLKKSFSGSEERKEIVSLSELYFKDYLERYKDYDISSAKCLADPSYKEDIIVSNNSIMLPKGIEKIARERERKIVQFKRLKALGEREKVLYNSMKSKEDDEVVREYFIVMLKKWAVITSDELEKILMEKEILEHAPESERQPLKNEGDQEKPKPLKPIIITRNEVQKKIYGLGYPSIPIMTVDEFYQQRYPENAENGPPSAAEMNDLLYRAQNPDVHKKELEKEDEETERKVENDDPELLQHTRAFDDWKDVNRRGCGNRKNKG